MKKPSSKTLSIPVTQSEHDDGQETGNRSSSKSAMPKRLAQFFALCLDSKIGRRKIGEESKREQANEKRKRIQPVEHITVQALITSYDDAIVGQGSQYHSRKDRGEAARR